MGLIITKVFFANELPSFAEVQKLFFEQTGLRIRLCCDLDLQNLQSESHDIFRELLRDSKEVESLFLYKEIFYSRNSSNYEALAKYRDEFTVNLSSLNHITNIRLNIPNFYDVNFLVEKNQITIEYFTSQKYGVTSLISVFISLGGLRQETNSEKFIKEKPIRLKKWSDYKWYNRPKK